MPNGYTTGRTLTLSKTIAAIDIREGFAGQRLGLMSQLQPGTTLQICGPGFNERTIEIESAGRHYIVFLEDLRTRAYDAVQN